MSLAHFRTAESYSKEALYGAANSLRKNPRSLKAGTWECQRLAALDAEISRRNVKTKNHATK